MPPRKRTAAPGPPERPALTVARDELAQQIETRIAIGRDLVSRLEQAWTQAEFDDVRGDKYSWSEYNYELLRRSATTDELAADCQIVHYVFNDPTPSSVTDDVQSEIRKLASLRDRLPLIESLQVAEPMSKSAESADGEPSAVFIVHGQQEAPKLAVARFCHQVTGNEAIILHEQPNSGQTVIEKFERHASDAGYAVVLLTADDIGGAKDGAQSPRGRQNVIFEAGFFIGALGRRRVAILYEESVELPSDLSGVVWIALDPAGAWKFHLAKELRVAGILVDMNKVL